MHLRDAKNNYLTDVRDNATACCVLRDDFREALITGNSKIFRCAVGFCAYGTLICPIVQGLPRWLPA